MSKIIHGDCLEVMKEIPDNSIDAVITDPPYGTGYGKVAGDETLEVYLNSLAQIFRVLKDKTFLIIYCFPLYVPEVIAKAREVGFRYRWIGMNYYPNMFKQKPQPLGYNRTDLWLVFSKGDAKKRGYIKDVIHILMDSKNNKTRDYGHPHQKPEKCAEKLIHATTEEGDTILDPFCGTGVFCATAKKMGRKSIGIDIDENYIKTARERVESVIQFTN